MGERQPHEELELRAPQGNQEASVALGSSEAPGGGLKSTCLTSVAVLVDGGWRRLALHLLRGQDQQVNSGNYGRRDNTAKHPLDDSGSWPWIRFLHLERTSWSRASPPGSKSHPGKEVLAI